MISSLSALSFCFIQQQSGQKRLIIDLSYVNKYLWKQSIKFEDWKVFQNHVSEDSFLYKLHLQKGYYHLYIFRCIKNFPGFSWFHGGKERFFIFTVFPFGLSNAPFIFIKGQAFSSILAVLWCNSYLGHSDASDLGVGAVLRQLENNDRRMYL